MSVTFMLYSFILVATGMALGLLWAADYDDYEENE